MENDAFLSLDTTGRSSRSAVSSPSPVLDLVYACYYLRGLAGPGKTPLDWAAALRRRDPELVASASELVSERDCGSALFAMALELGYAGDESPDRFLLDLPRLLELLDEAFPERREEGGDIPSWLSSPPDEAWIASAARVLGELWNAIGPVWSESGRRAAEDAAREVREQLVEHGDVLRALPRRHFAQFEARADSLREAFEQGTLRIVPLAFAEGGGFHLKGERVTAVGFGLHGERLHEDTQRKVGRAAERARVLADPTRLMLLNLIARFDGMEMTVGDMARQLGVSQPTVSGHLKLLREAGLVTTERKGNRTLPRAESGAIGETLEALAEVLRVN